MKQENIKLLERAYAQLCKAYGNINSVEEHLLKHYEQNKWIGDRNEYSIVKEVAIGVWREGLNFRCKLDSIKEVNKV